MTNQVSSHEKFRDETDQYAVERKIGEGGFGKVYVAQHKDTKKKYIFKISKKKDVAGLETQLRNLEAVRILCRKYFVCPYAMIRFRSFPVLVMDYLEGFVDLFTYITSSTYKKTYKDLVTISRNMLTGLRALHKLGVAHRDIKPENIMVNPKTLDIRFIDFGFACSSRQDCLSAPLFRGTARYLAPEIVIRSKGAAPHLDLKSMQATDLFSLGLVIAILFHPRHAHPLSLAGQKLHIRQVGKTYKNLFLRMMASPHLLKQLNDTYIAAPLDSPHLDLLNLDPRKRRIVLSRKQSRLTPLPSSDDMVLDQTKRIPLLRKTKTV